jgi:hypothetical protein
MKIKVDFCQSLCYNSYIQLCLKVEADHGLLALESRMERRKPLSIDTILLLILAIPLILFQAAFCLPLLVILLESQVSDNTLKRCWLGYGLLLLTFIFFSRFFSDFYLGIIVSALALGYLSEDGRNMPHRYITEEPANVQLC